VRFAETLLDKNMRVCGTMRANRGHSTWPRRRKKTLENRAYSFPENGDI